MRAIVADWVAFCEGRITFDKSHFTTLFHDNCSMAELGLIVKSSGCSDIFDPIRAVLFEKKWNDSSAIDLGNLIEIAISDFKNMQSIAKLADSDFVTIEDFSISFFKSWNDYLEVLINQGGRGFIFDEIIDPFLTVDCFPNDYKLDALYEALYGLHNNYDLAKSIFFPYFTKKVDYSGYLRLFKLDCSYIYCNKTNSLVLASKTSNLYDVSLSS